ncbi:ASPIC/UnbV domain-containing protein [Botrimarina hoheduenensis]|uniref:ASPIC and UnbV n=1 Tax=Botrimarina hoheduenensis TaxID=2528000 RepID=A0A5C5VND7_9BACT|nr:ASPIC/UnbV domain-containing protein [Botrimarina hoheduenensis]TWT40088.1 ASPIC and UnbV [Botrimarina hoheduenensis]
MSKSNRCTARWLLAGLQGMVGSQPCCAVQFADVTMSAGLTHTQWDLPATDTDAIRDESVPDNLLYHEINAGSHYLGQSEAIAHFGLGDHPEAIDLIVIEWPASSAVQVIRDRSPNSLLTVVEPLPGDFNADGNIDAVDYTV